jgi:hypothetical protein
LLRRDNGTTGEASRKLIYYSAQPLRPTGHLLQQARHLRGVFRECDGSRDRGRF